MKRLQSKLLFAVLLLPLLFGILLMGLTACGKVSAQPEKDIERKCVDYLPGK
jgi:hypothetical protein